MFNYQGDNGRGQWCCVLIFDSEFASWTPFSVFYGALKKMGKAWNLYHKASDRMYFVEASNAMQCFIYQLYFC